MTYQQAVNEAARRWPEGQALFTYKPTREGMLIRLIVGEGCPENMKDFVVRGIQSIVVPWEKAFRDADNRASRVIFASRTSGAGFPKTECA